MVKFIQLVLSESFGSAVDLWVFCNFFSLYKNSFIRPETIVTGRKKKDCNTNVTSYYVAVMRYCASGFFCWQNAVAKLRRDAHKRITRNKEKAQKGHKQFVSVATNGRYQRLFQIIESSIIIFKNIC